MPFGSRLLHKLLQVHSPFAFSVICCTESNARWCISICAPWVVQSCSEKAHCSLLVSNLTSDQLNRSTSLSIPSHVFTFSPTTLCISRYLLCIFLLVQVSGVESSGTGFSLCFALHPSYTRNHQKSTPFGILDLFSRTRERTIPSLFGLSKQIQGKSHLINLLRDTISRIQTTCNHRAINPIIPRAT
jgi:hypothetical protein